MSQIIIQYFSFRFVFQLKEVEDAWYNLDHQISVDQSHTMCIDANQEVYATITDKGKTIFGKILDENHDHPADNFLIRDGEVYFFHRLKKSIYESR